jgi:DNA-binding IclR family transcriptional regulator
VTVETFTAGLSAMAAPVRLGNRRPIGVITIAGPTVRFTEKRMHALAPELLSLCDQMAAASGTSPFFQGAHSGNGGPKSGRLPIYAA